MKAKQFLMRIIQEQSNPFFSAIRTHRAVGLNKRKLDHSWKGQGYKIYPSSIKSLDMCPKKYVEEIVHKPPAFPLDTIYLMELGKAMHSMFQDECVEWDKEIVEGVAAEYLEGVDAYVRAMYKKEASSINKFLYPRPRDLGPMLEEKYAKLFPEVPGYDEESGFSFRCDLVLNIDDHPAILDIKTTSMDPNQWKNPSPSEEHKLQVRFYGYFMNKHKYYDKPIKKIGLAYINLLMRSGSVGSEYEWWDTLEGEDVEVENLIKHLTIHRNAAINGTIEECNYNKCSIHKEQNSE